MTLMQTELHELFRSGGAADIIKVSDELLPIQEKDISLWRSRSITVWSAVVSALCWVRDNEGEKTSLEIFVQNTGLSPIERLYLKGLDISIGNGGVWPVAFHGVKDYLETYLPGYSIKTLLENKLRELSAQCDMVKEAHNYTAAGLTPLLYAVNPVQVPADFLVDSQHA